MSVASFASKESGMTVAWARFGAVIVRPFKSNCGARGRTSTFASATPRLDRSIRSDGKHDLSLRLRPHAFQHQMSLARFRERQHCSHLCSKFSTIDQAGDLRQIPARDFDEKEGG